MQISRPTYLEPTKSNTDSEMVSSDIINSKINMNSQELTLTFTWYNILCKGHNNYHTFIGNSCMLTY